VEGVLGSTGTLGRGSIRHAVSGDGRHVYWENRENGPSALYLTDTAAGKTVRLDLPGPGAVGGKAEPIFQGASADGRRALFTDTQHLSPESGEGGADLYACAVGEGAGGPECPPTDITPETPEGESARVQGMVSAIDEAADSAYFVADGALAAGAEPGDCTIPPTPGATCSLYHAKLEGGSWTVGFVARLSNADWPDWAGGIGGAGAGQEGTGLVLASGSPDGRYLAFMSERDLTGHDNADAASGEADEEVFRYDAQGGTLACVSCDPGGARPRGTEIPTEEAKAFKLPADWHLTWGGRWLAGTLPDPSWSDGAADLPTYQPRSMLDDGRVLFTSYDGLVAADTDGTADAYEYEPWGTGSCSASSGGGAIAQAEGEACVALLSSGDSPEESSVLDASAGGEDVFILTAAKLSVLDEDPDYDIYDARVDGVVARRAEPGRCGEEGGEEVCQPQTAAPGAAGTATGQSGAGNVHEKAPRPKACPKGKVKKHGRCVKKPRRHKKKQQHHKGRHGKNEHRRTSR
jgi:hypothetical protein